MLNHRHCHRRAATGQRFLPRERRNSGRRFLTKHRFWNEVPIGISPPDHPPSQPKPKPLGHLKAASINHTSPVQRRAERLQSLEVGGDAQIIR